MGDVESLQTIVRGSDEIVSQSLDQIVNLVQPPVGRVGFNRFNSPTICAQVARV